jgi:hypothetical protein
VNYQVILHPVSKAVKEPGGHPYGNKSDMKNISKSA